MLFSFLSSPADHKMITWTPGVCESSSQELHEVRLYLPFRSVDICTFGTKAKAGKAAGALAPQRAVAPDCTSSHCFLLASHSHEKGEEAVSLINASDKVLKKFYFNENSTLEYIIF